LGNDRCAVGKSLSRTLTNYRQIQQSGDTRIDAAALAKCSWSLAAVRGYACPSGMGRAPPRDARARWQEEAGHRPKSFDTSDACKIIGGGNASAGPLLC